MRKRVALITGGSRGLGLDLSRYLATLGYDLVVVARDPQRLEAAAADLRQLGTEVTTVAGDIADPDHRRRAVLAAEASGRLDLLVNNASELGASPLPVLAEYPLAVLERVLAVNVIAPLGLIQEALPLLERSDGLILNVSSDAALGGYPGWGAYGASKAALDLVSRTLATELAPNGVTVVAVDPGDMRTAMHQDAYPGEDIYDRPLPEITLPFWAWLLDRPHAEINGRRFQAQAEVWEVVP
jgi:NAD(P)-dependent dehydrogenase (short-subunit alcohol dehydrogenase family)